MEKLPNYTLPFEKISKEDVRIAGGKGANLGEMTQIGIPVPPGFVVTAQAYFDFVAKQGIAGKIKTILHGTNVDVAAELAAASHRIQKLIIESDLDSATGEQIKKAYKETFRGKKVLVAVRSSATAEDLPGASFAGQQETFLNISGEDEVVEAVKRAWASLFTQRAIFYREQKHFDHFKVGIAIPVQKMVEADTSGVMFTVDPVTADKSKIVIEAIWGLGEFIVQGAVNPDHFEVDKHSGKIVAKTISVQDKQLLYVRGENREVAISRAWREKQKITDHEVLAIAELGKKLERHYFFPQDIEWAIEKRRIYIVQTRPVTTLKSAGKGSSGKVVRTDDLPVLLSGSPASPGIVSGPVRLIGSASEVARVLPGEVLVTTMTNPDFVPAMRRAIAVVTDQGGRTSHAAIVSRELGIPAVVGCLTATKVLKNGIVVTVDGSSGKVFSGSKIKNTHKVLEYLESKVFQSSTLPLVKTATKVYVNLGEPELAGEVAQRNVDGVGLLRAEFMMASIGIHPKKMIADGRSKEYVDTLAKDLQVFAQSFYPRPVVYRASDFKTNEYRNLRGGDIYEPKESNPMLGFRGAFRYISDPAVFKLELSAIGKVRSEGFSNLYLMIPFVRTVDELSKVRKIVVASGLTRSPSFKLWMMVEIPANVILLPKFIEVGIDGVSIGSNDLTMLTLGTDRDNEEVASEFSETNEAVYWAIQKTIESCQRLHATSSICGQAPSVYPDMVEKLVGWGATSVSVSPDAVERVRAEIVEAEKKVGKR